MNNKDLREAVDKAGALDARVKKLQKELTELKDTIKGEAEIRKQKEIKGTKYVAKIRPSTTTSCYK